MQCNNNIVFGSYAELIVVGLGKAHQILHWIQLVVEDRATQSLES